MTLEREKTKYRNFSLAFEQMCCFVAISATRSQRDTLKQLILQCLVILPDDKFQTACHFKERIDSLFGLQVLEDDVQKSIDQLIEEKAIVRPAGTNFTLTPSIRETLQKRIDEANALESKVKQEWFDEISKNFPILSNDKAWSVLRKYLAKAFRRHGIQTAALLDPSIDVAPEYSESLISLLNETLKDNLTPELNKAAQKAISGFLANIGSHPERAEYFVQLGDGAFNYFSLMIAPDVADSFRKKLNQLTIFFDTNVLFGLLNLHIHHHVEVSNQLLSAIKKHNFPFTLRYHQATEKEMLSTIDYYGSLLRARTWPPAISRAAITSPYLSGIELKYHQLNAERGTDVESFLKPYAHIDILLKEKGILIYRSNEDRMYERATLLNEYKDFFKSRNKKEKHYDALNHDTIVLDTVHQLRSDAPSSLDAGALVVTSDYNLYLFDGQMSRRQGHRACTVLPNLLFQILRPFIPADKDFDRSFAEAFAIPEFRTIAIGSGASVACSKMLNLLASFKDFPEETAAKLLSNDLLIDRLRAASDDKKFQEIVESAIVDENAVLLEEKAALAKQLERDRAEKETAAKGLEEEKVALAKQLERDRAEKEAVAKKVKEEQSKLLENLSFVERNLRDKEAELKTLETAVAKENERALEAINKAEIEKKEKEKAKSLVNKFAVATAGLVSAILIIIFEFCIYWYPWNWLINHQRSIALQVSIDVLLTLFMFGFFLPKKWQKWFWRGGVLPIFYGMLQLL